MTAREAARRFIESIFEVEGADFELTDAIAKLNSEDRGLFQEISHGTLREWMFLTWAVSRNTSRLPSRAVLIVLNISSYQLLFLDRVPEYAIFSEAKAMSSGLGLSEPELRFVHGVLKTIQREKEKLMAIRAGSLERAHEGRAPESQLEWAVLNVPPQLVDALTIVLEKGKKKDARSRAIKAVAEMKERARLVGYLLPGRVAKSVTAPLMSEVAPRALILKGSPELADDLKNLNLRVQGEASQWACEIAARKLFAAQSDKKLRVLEMATGKGGKLLGSLAALTALKNGDCSAVPEMEWVAADASDLQLKVLKFDVLPVVSKYWPQVKVKLLRTDWDLSPAFDPASKFDFIWLDAPCTGFGTLSKLPQISLKRGEDAYNEALKLSEIQKSLCSKGLDLMAIGGSFFYSVCTLTFPETFKIVEFCREKSNRAPELIQSLWPGSPPARYAEGFFAALF